MINDEIRYKLLKILRQDPNISQRTLANRLGISLGRANFCIQALIERGLVKVNNFRNNENKQVYAYLLTPRGIEEKARITVRFLRSKLQEYEQLENEIEELRNEVNDLKTTPVIGHIKESGLPD